jgi:hypothetical protein
VPYKPLPTGGDKGSRGGALGSRSGDEIIGLFT